MNKFSLVKGADAEVLLEIQGWTNKIGDYVRDFFENDISRTRATGFGDCISKIVYFSERAVTEPDTFRGVRDVQGRLQAGAIVEPYFDYFEIDAFTNAPWNVLKNQPETIKGAATSLMEELVNESKALGMSGRIKLLAIERARSFYTKIGFIESEDGSGELELTPTAAEEFLQRQRNRRHNESK